jgi:hypothetical protein
MTFYCLGMLHSTSATHGEHNNSRRAVNNILQTMNVDGNKPPRLQGNKINEEQPPTKKIKTSDETQSAPNVSGKNTVTFYYFVLQLMQNE